MVKCKACAWVEDLLKRIKIALIIITITMWVMPWMYQNHLLAYS